MAFLKIHSCSLLSLLFYSTFLYVQSFMYEKSRSNSNSREVSTKFAFSILHWAEVWNVLILSQLCFTVVCFVQKQRSWKQSYYMLKFLEYVNKKAYSLFRHETTIFFQFIKKITFFFLLKGTDWASGVR